VIDTFWTVKLVKVRSVSGLTGSKGFSVMFVGLKTVTLLDTFAVVFTSGITTGFIKFGFSIGLSVMFGFYVKFDTIESFFAFSTLA
jgi:hypothetical protein